MSFPSDVLVGFFARKQRQHEKDSTKTLFRETQNIKKYQRGKLS